MLGGFGSVKQVGRCLVAQFDDTVVGEQRGCLGAWGSRDPGVERESLDGLAALARDGDDTVIAPCVVNWSPGCGMDTLRAA